MFSSWRFELALTMGQYAKDHLKNLLTVANSRAHQGFSLKINCSSLRNGTIRWQCREIALQVLRALFWLFLFKGTECRGFGEREGGPGDNENKSMGRLCLMAFIFFLNINGFKPKFHKHLCMNKSANMYICATSSTL